MLENNFVELGTFNRLKPGKRALRLIIGMALIAYFMWQLTVYDTLLTKDILLVPWGKWIGAAILFYWFSDVFNTGFNRRWGRWPQTIFLVLLGSAVIGDFMLYGTIWGPPAGWLVYLMQQFTAFMIGIGFILSAALATPG